MGGDDDDDDGDDDVDAIEGDGRTGAAPGETLSRSLRANKDNLVTSSMLTLLSSTPTDLAMSTLSCLSHSALSVVSR